VVLDQELETFRRELQKMLAEHPGEYVLIHGDDVNSFWPTEDDAYVAGCDRFGLAPFLVKQVLESEPVAYSYLDIHRRCRP
jgi:hypothetical protein